MSKASTKWDLLHRFLWQVHTKTAAGGQEHNLWQIKQYQHLFSGNCTSLFPSNFYLL